LGAILALMALGVGLLAWRLSEGPMPLTLFESQIEAELTAARDGRTVDLDGLALAWGGPEKGLVMVASAVRVFNAQGAEQTAADGVDIGIDLGSLFLGRMAISGLAFRGGEVTITLKQDRSATLAFGGPSAAPDLMIPAPMENQPIMQQVEWALDALEEALRPLGAGGQLRRVSAHGLKLTIQDDRGGALWTASDARVDGRRTQDQIALTTAASFTGPRGPAPASLAITTDAAFSTALIELVARDVRLNALLPSQILGPLEKVRAPVTASITLGVDRAQGITRIDGDLALGQGDIDVAGGKLAFQGAALRGRYDVKSDVLVVDDVKLDGARTSVTGEIRFRNASAFLGVNNNRVAPFDLELSELTLDVPGFLGDPTPLTNVTAKGRLLITQNAIELESAVAYLDGAPARATGRFGLADDGAGVVRPSIKLDATLEGEADVRKVIAFWPLPLDPEARSWAGARIVSGRVRNARARLDIRAQDLRPAVLRERGMARERVDVTFDFSQARVQYLDGMAPIEQGAGRAFVEGDRLDLTLDQARLAGLAVDKGRIYLPSLQRRLRDPAVFRLTATGPLTTVIDVLRQAPLKLDESLPFDPATVDGAGAVTIDVKQWERRRGDAAPLVTFDVDGQFDKVGAVFKNGVGAIADARVSVTGDHNALTISGPVTFGASRTEVVWTQNLRPGAATPSRFAIAGRVHASELASLGFSVGDAISGPIRLEVRGVGNGAKFTSAGVRMDLTQAILRLPGGLWTKPAGQEATLAFEAQTKPDGGLRVRDLDLRAAGGVFAAGGAEFGVDGRLASARLGRFLIGDKTAVAVTADRDSAGVLVVNAEGAAFDLGPWLGGVAPPAPTSTPASAPTNAEAAAEAVRVRVRVDKAHLRGGVALSKAALRLDAMGPAMLQLSVDGRTPDGGDFSLSVGDGDGPGPLRFSAADAGFAVRGLTGADNVRGGVVQASGDWRPGAPGRADFTITASDFKIVRMGALAELLSSVSSLTGLVDTLNGEGIAFKGLEAPVVLDNAKLTVRDARAAGDSLGITARGDIDLSRGRVALDGVVAPAYGLNALFTDVPVLGPILTSRPGEGVVGITYSVAGPVDAAKVGVNPLSALAPGFLRRIFEPVEPRDDREPMRRPKRAG
jgi:hypothetical protein